jgi:hypothetical protein
MDPNYPPGTSEYDLGGSRQDRRILARQREWDEAKAEERAERERGWDVPEREEWSAEEPPNIV